MNKQNIHRLPLQSITVSVDSVIFGYSSGNLRVLLIRREAEPFRGKWCLPGGILHENKTTHEQARVILVEKAGVVIEYLEQLYTFDDLTRDPRSRTLSVTYFALINHDKYEISTERKAHDAKWFDVSHVPKLAFDHDTILKVALNRLQSKVVYQPIGFELLDEEFTLSELQELYEVLLQTRLDKRNFRKRILSMQLITTTGKKKIGVRNRLPELYKFDNKQYNKLLKEGFNIKIV